MPVDLEELARIVEAAIGDTKVDAKVQRDAAPAALRAQIVEALETGPDSNRGRS